MFFQVENQWGLNRVYSDDNTYPFGASVLPYTYGSWNKYAPKPFGLKVHSPIYSVLANAGIQNRLAPDGNDIDYAPFYGPTNAIYEVVIQGIENYHCSDCTNLNGIYYLYSDKFNPGPPSQINPVVSPGDATLFQNAIDGSHVDVTTAGLTWSTHYCERVLPINFCGIDSISLQFQQFPGPLNGEVVLDLKLWRQNARLHTNQSSNKFASGIIYFRKSFGYIEAWNANYNSSKPYMLEEEHILTPYILDTNNTKWPDISVPGINGYSLTGDITFDNCTCDLTDAEVLIRPYKTDFYDVKSTTMNFADLSDIAYKTISQEFIEGTEYYYVPAGTHFSANDNSNPNSVLRSADNFYKNFSNYRKIIANDYFMTEPSGYAYQFWPTTLQLTFDKLSLDTFKNDCSTCYDYYRRNKNLNLFGTRLDSDGTTGTRLISYKWFGMSNFDYMWHTSGTEFTNFDFDFDDISRFYHNHYNICDHGCNNAVKNGNDNFSNGPCNNFIELILREISTVNPVSNSGYIVQVDATLYLGSTWNSGILLGDGRRFTNPQTTYSKYVFNKTICDDTNLTNKCTDLVGVFTSPTDFIRVNVGKIDYFNTSVWSSPGWTIGLRNSTTDINRFKANTPDEFDVFNYCDFVSSGIINLAPPSSPAPCTDWRCTIINNYEVAETVDVGITVSPLYSGPPPSGAEIDYFASYGTQHYALDMHPTICKWSANVGVSGSEMSLEFKTITNGYCIFEFNGTIGGLSGHQISLTTKPISGINTGFCNATVSESGVGRHFPTGTIAGISNVIDVNVIFDDLYDIRDYL